jgi:heme/copper-type cytochrome/quinol oxidase subunit 2
MMRLKFTALLIFLITAQILVSGQSPDMYPPPVPQPVEVDTFNIILYIVLPVLIVVAYFSYKNWQKKQNKSNKK